MGQFASRLWRVVNKFRGVNSTLLEFPTVDLTGKWIIVSGGNNGLGFEAAKFFAKSGANLVLACREAPSYETPTEKAVEECQAIAANHGHNPTIEWWRLDMDKVSSVEAFGQRWLETGRPLDVLCNNAGMTARRKLANPISDDGFELVHQVNFLSHVLLTHILLPAIAKSSHARIVCTTSCRHFDGEFDLEHFNGEEGMPGDAYGNNKLYFQMWLTELQARLRENDKYKHITINGVHPGFVNSGIFNSVPGQKDTLSLRINRWLAEKLAVTPEQGSLCIVNGATNPELGPEALGGGNYINRIWVSPAMPICHNVLARLMLWKRLDEDLKLDQKGLLEGLED